MKRCGIGIIGCGGIADLHLDALAGIEQAEIRMVASRSEARARKAAEKCGSRWTTDYRELLRDPTIEAVCVTTSSGSHGTIAMEALKSRKHVLVEKPIAMTSAEADALIQLADARGLRLGVVSQSRFAGHHRLIKQLIEEGKLGRLLLVEISRPFYRTQEYYDSADWRGTIAEDGGALMNQGIHSIDLLLWLGGKVRTVTGRVATQTHRMEAEDIGLAILTMENGAFATVMASTSTAPGYPATIHVYGEKGSVRIEGPAITHWSVPDMAMPEYGYDGSSGSGASNPLGFSPANHRLQLLDFLESIRDGRKPAVKGEDGRDAVRLIERIRQSSADGGKPVLF